MALLCFVFTLALHGDAVFAHVSLVEKESTLRFSVFFLRLKSGESLQCSDDWCVDNYVVSTFTKFCVVVTVLRRHNTDKAGDG